MKHEWKIWLGVCAVGVMAACSGGVNDPVAPSPARPTLETNGSGGVSAQGKPDAVFKTVPAAGPDGVVRGRAPLTVQFNNCQSRPTEDGDDLKFTYDFDNDGAVDAFGHCRWEQTYTAPATARVCVSDRRPGNEVCQEWEISPGASRNVTSLSLTMDNVNCSATAGFEFYINGVATGTFTSSAPCSCSVAGNIETVTFSSGPALAAWTVGGPNTVRFVKATSYTTSPAVAYVKLQVMHEDGSQTSSCIFDADGSSACAGVTPCTTPQYRVSPVDVSATVND
jgi:hypothetical protein